MKAESIPIQSAINGREEMNNGRVLKDEHPQRRLEQGCGLGGEQSGSETRRAFHNTGRKGDRWAIPKRGLGPTQGTKGNALIVF